MDGFWDLLPVITGSITLWFYLYVYRPSQRKNSKKHEQHGGTLMVRSFSDGSTKYTINPSQLTCNCPDFSERRSPFNHDDPRRLCKHLITVVAEAPSLFSEYSLYRSAIKEAAKRQSGFQGKAKRNIISADNEKLAIFTAENPNEYNDGEGQWMDIYFRGQRHGYNPVKDLWTHSFRSDPNIDDITRFIRKEICKYDEEFA